MGKFRTYLKVFNNVGDYEDDFIEITDDVLKIGDFSQGIDNSNYGVGTLKNSNLRLELVNLKGKYSDTNNLRSIFNYKRKNSIIKVTWDRRTTPLYCGAFLPGIEPLGGEVTIFEGVLNDVSSTSDIVEQNAEFTVMGYESLLHEMIVPYSSVGATANISVVLYTMLNQAPFNELVTVNQANIVPGLDYAIDSKTDLENKTVGESLANILLVSLSVLVIRDNVVYVRARDADATVSKTFYGQSSAIGIEDVIDIGGYTDGVNRILNYWTWRSTTLKSTDTTSTDTYGVQKIELNSSLLDVGSTSKIQAILDGYKDDFISPKIELELTVGLEYYTLALQMLNKVKIDYPAVYVPADSNPLPRYGLVKYGEARYPYGRFDLTIDSEFTSFKILQKRISLANNMITFKLREN